MKRFAVYCLTMVFLVCGAVFLLKIFFPPALDAKCSRFTLSLRSLWLCGDYLHRFKPTSYREFRQVVEQDDGSSTNAFPVDRGSSSSVALPLWFPSNRQYRCIPFIPSNCVPSQIPFIWDVSADPQDGNLAVVFWDGYVSPLNTDRLPRDMSRLLTSNTLNALLARLREGVTSGPPLDVVDCYTR